MSRNRIAVSYIMCLSGVIPIQYLIFICTEVFFFPNNVCRLSRFQMFRVIYCRCLLSAYLEYLTQGHRNYLMTLCHEL